MYVDNTIVWILAFAPILGFLLENFIEGLSNGHLQADKLWFVAIILNIALSELDAKKLMIAGIDTSKFRSLTWLVPVCLFQRSKALKQDMYYLVVWVICFVFLLTDA
jgi:hypothetical protein